MQTMPQGGWVFDLRVNQPVTLDPGDGRERVLTLCEVREPRDAVRGTIREPSVLLDIDGEAVEIKAALYNLPRSVAGMRVDCAVTRGVAESIAVWKDVFCLSGDARIRCWPDEGFLFGLTPIVYPVQQRWFASMTQLGNEKTYVDAGELTNHQPGKHVYYHFGTDIGGYDKAVPIVAAVGGRVVRLGTEWAPDEAEDEYPRDDVVRIIDDRGWRYRYSHLDMINPDLRIDQRVEAGHPVGFLGQKGASGGWSHLHFGMKAPQPDGRLGQVNAYPFFAEAYLHENPGSLLACARPHRVAAVGETVRLDASNSICDGGTVQSYAWALQNGTTGQGPVIETVYDEEGMYSEMVTVTDDRGQTDVDFCVVQILPADADPARTPPTMHLTTYPTTDIRPGQPIAFKARAFIRGPFAENKAGIERWDFGDGSTAVSCSDECFDERWHAYAKPGRYIVTVQRTAKNGITATAQLKVIVG
jgi:murein DD-endopeptidase MepM/ murein hydrolase activator NlpD